MKKFEFDFYKELELPTPVLCGLVQKVTAPKGKRTMNESIHQYSYELHTDLVNIYDFEETPYEPGLYWVMDVYKHKSVLRWNHYLIIIEDDGTVYAVGEYLNCHDTTWIKKAVKVVNAYFEGEELDPIGITQCKTDKPTKKHFKA